MKAIRKPTERLEDLQNVGPTVARLLAAAGIRTPGELRRRGAVLSEILHDPGIVSIDLRSSTFWSAGQGNPGRA